MNTHYTNPYTGQQLTVARPNPQKRNILIQKLGRAPWWLLILLGGVLLFAVSVADSMTYQNAWTAVQRGIWTTIWVTLVAYTISLVMGLVLALLRRPSTSMVYNIFVYQPVTAYVELVRGIPTLVLVFYFALALAPQVILLLNDLGRWLLDSGINPGGLSEEMIVLRARDFPTVWRAILALAVSYSAFLSEVFRAGLDSIEYGQQEAAISLGMNRRQVMRFIILPQAIRNILPPLGNDFIAMLKESSLVSMVGVQDITREGQAFAAATFTFFQAFNVIALTYLILTLSLSMMVKGLENYLARGRDR